MSHRLPLFSLLPLNPAASKVVESPENGGIVTVHMVDGVHRRALDIGRTLSKLGDSATLATLGRCGDVVVKEPYISRIQCSFEINPSSKVVMFCDRSPGQTSEVFGDEAFPLSRGDKPKGARKVAVTRKINTIIGMGGTSRNLIRFRLLWQLPKDDSDQAFQSRIESRPGFDAALAQTIDVWEPATIPASPSSTPLEQSRIRFCSPDGTNGLLGAGTFGSVHKMINVDTGNLLAVKYIKVPAIRKKKFTEHLEREVRVLAKLTHPHIVMFLGYKHKITPREEIQVLMGLEDGTLESLVEKLVQTEDLELGDGFLYLENVVWETALHHMLQALDFLASHKMIHRDVKPENILYTLRQPRAQSQSQPNTTSTPPIQRPDPQDYHFRLGDLGLVNSQDFASTLAGTPLFMAPEMTQMFEANQDDNDKKQTHKMDVWSLFVSMLWTADLYTNSEQWFQNKLVAASRANSLQVGRIVEGLLVSEKSKTMLSPSAEDVLDMAWADPERRASAAQMLVYRFEGRGLTTPLEQVPELVRMPSPPLPPPSNPQAEASNSNSLANNQRSDDMQLTLQMDQMSIDHDHFSASKWGKLLREEDNMFQFK